MCFEATVAWYFVFQALIALFEWEHTQINTQPCLVYFHIFYLFENSNHGQIVVDEEHI